MDYFFHIIIIDISVIIILFDSFLSGLLFLSCNKILKNSYPILDSALIFHIINIDMHLFESFLSCNKIHKNSYHILIGQDIIFFIPLSLTYIIYHNPFRVLSIVFIIFIFSCLFVVWWRLQIVLNNRTSVWDNILASWRRKNRRRPELLTYMKIVK